MTRPPGEPVPSARGPENIFVPVENAAHYVHLSVGRVEVYVRADTALAAARERIVGELREEADFYEKRNITTDFRYASYLRGVADFVRQGGRDG